MNERQQIVCASALFSDGFSHEQIASALKIELKRASELTQRGSDEQAAGTMGHMASCPHGKDHIVTRRDDNGSVARILHSPPIRVPRPS